MKYAFEANCYKTFQSKVLEKLKKFDLLLISCFTYKAGGHDVS